MSHLEESVKRVMVGFMTGERKMLTPFDQFILATWATKTSLTYDASYQDQWIPNDIGTYRLFSAGYPPLGTQIVIGAAPFDGSWMINQTQICNLATCVYQRDRLRRMLPAGGWASEGGSEWTTTPSL
jgi:hypothetical protein